MEAFRNTLGSWRKAIGFVRDVTLRRFAVVHPKSLCAGSVLFKAKKVSDLRQLS